MKSLSVLILMFFLVSVSSQAAIYAPEAPPELPESLKNFRTEAQLHELDEIKNQNADDGDLEELEIQSSPFIPGDDSSGVVRFANVYVPKLVMGVPDRGMLIVRFFDADGNPWEIDKTELEQPGFSCEITASPSELMVKQQHGATVTSMTVTMRGSNDLLVFTLRPARLVRGGVKVNTLIENVKLKTSQEQVKYKRPDSIEFAVPNPKATTVSFKDTTTKTVEKRLLEAVRALKNDDQ